MEKPLVTFIVPEDVITSSINHQLRRLGISQAMRRKLRAESRCYRNGTPISWNTLLHGGDSLTVYHCKATQISPWDTAMDIIFEDEYLLVINKPAGLLMHPTATERTHTLANALISYFTKSDQQASFHPIHRLDKDTSGLVIIAKNAVVQHAFTKQHRPIRKIYEAIVMGHFPSCGSTVHWPIARRPNSIIERCCHIGGKKAHTDFLALCCGDTYSHLQCHLHTGRTHQIRVHCASLGFPLAGDDLYGGARTDISRQALHAATLSFVHPITGVYHTFHAPLPEDMKHLLAKLV